MRTFVLTLPCGAQCIYAIRWFSRSTAIVAVNWPNLLGFTVATDCSLWGTKTIVCIMWTTVSAWQQTGNVGKCAGHVTPKYRGAQIRGARSTERISIVRLRLSMWDLSAELDIWYDMIWCMIWYIFNRNWVDTRWQQYGSHLHTNNTQNTEIGTYITIKKSNIHNNTKLTNLGSGGRAPSLRVIPWHLSYRHGKISARVATRISQADTVQYTEEKL
jgi:hypothetical protein